MSAWRARGRGLSGQQAGRDVGRGARGEGRCEELGAIGSGRRAGLRARGLPPLNYPTIQARGFMPWRVGKTTGANPGGYQAIAMGGISQGDHRRLCHRPVPPCGAAFGGDSQRHLGAYGVDLSRHGPRVPVDSALHCPRLPPAPGQKVRGARVSAAHYLAPAAAGHCLHQPLQPLAGAKPHG